MQCRNTLRVNKIKKRKNMNILTIYFVLVVSQFDEGENQQR